MSIGFGFKARIGHLYPSGGLCDYEIQAMAPDGVQFLTTRLPFSQATLESDIALVENVEAHARLLASAEVALIAMNCTAASMAVGAVAINQRIEAATQIASITTIEAVLAALRAVGARRVALLAPYPADVVEMEKAFLAGHGVEVIAQYSEPCVTPVEQGTLPATHWARLAATIDCPQADALLISCAGIQLASVLDEIERRFGRPVIASNPALLWHCLRVLNLPERPQGYGALLAGRFDAGAAPVQLAARFTR
jgi:maleate isomerase